MMTSANPNATAKSRVQLRNSCRKRGKLELLAGSGGLVWIVSGIPLSNIYNTAR
jgi:hypothetical protein